MGRFGIKNVVGGWKESTPEEWLLPATLARTAVEHEQMKSFFGMRRERALDFGCGYGRNIPVLKHLAGWVHGVERDAELLRIAHEMHGNARTLFTRVDRLCETPLAPAQFDLVLSFTVLQHVLDDIQSTLKEIGRVMKSGGMLLMCEETDEGINIPEQSGRHGCVGRSIKWYCDHLRSHGFELHATAEREIDRGHKSGHYMLFEKED